MFQQASCLSGTRPKGPAGRLARYVNFSGFQIGVIFNTSQFFRYRLQTLSWAAVPEGWSDRSVIAGGASMGGITSSKASVGDGPEDGTFRWRFQARLASASRAH